jgi:hypothetical protein
MFVILSYSKEKDKPQIDFDIEKQTFLDQASAANYIREVVFPHYIKKVSYELKTKIDENRARLKIVGSAASIDIEISNNWKINRTYHIIGGLKLPEELRS